MLQLDSHAQRINKDSFLTGHNKVINSILNYAKCLVICDPVESNLLYGFIIFETRGEFDMIHYAYIRKDFRGLGLLKNIVDIVKTKKNLSISHTNSEIKPAKLKKYWDKVIFDCYTVIKER
jgi:hypothetical protein